MTESASSKGPLPWAGPIPDSAGFRFLASLDELDRAVESSSDCPVLVFKHSPTCGVSAEAFDEIAALLAEPQPAPVYLVHVIESRQVSNAIAERFGVRHQSPQVLLMSHRQVRWTASHFHVTAEKIRRAVEGLPSNV